MCCLKMCWHWDNQLIWPRLAQSITWDQDSISMFDYSPWWYIGKKIIWSLTLTFRKESSKHKHNKRHKHREKRKRSKKKSKNQDSSSESEWLHPISNYFTCVCTLQHSFKFYIGLSFINVQGLVKSENAKRD